MNAEQRQMAADLWTKLTDLSHRLLGNCIQYIMAIVDGIHYRPKADPHFVIPQRVEG